MADFEIRGADDVDALVKRIGSHADAKAIRKEMFAGLNRSTKEVRADMKDAIPDGLPKRGGLAGTAQRATRFNTSAKSGRNAGVTIWARSKGATVARANRTGLIGHPAWGNRKAWVTQSAGVRKGFLDETFEKQKPEITRDIKRVMEDIGRKVEGH